MSIIGEIANQPEVIQITWPAVAALCAVIMVVGTLLGMLFRLSQKAFLAELDDRFIRREECDRRHSAQRNSDLQRDSEADRRFRSLEEDPGGAI